MDVGFRGEDKGKEWALRRRSTGVWIWWSVLPSRTEEGARGMGLKQWSDEGVVVDWKKIMPPEGFVVLPRRWVVERSFAWICHNRRMSKDYERFLCARAKRSRICCHESPHAEAVSWRLRPFHTVSSTHSGE